MICEECGNPRKMCTCPSETSPDKQHYISEETDKYIKHKKMKKKVKVYLDPDTLEIVQEVLSLIYGKHEKKNELVIKFKKHNKT